VNAAKGNFDGPRQDYQIDANDQLVTSDDYRGWWSPTATARR
jgi:multidrug efflux pump